MSYRLGDGSTPSMPGTRAAPIASTRAYVQSSSAGGPTRSIETRQVFRKQLTCLTAKSSRPVAAESLLVVSSEASPVWIRTSPGMISGRVRSGGGMAHRRQRQRWRRSMPASPLPRLAPDGVLDLAPIARLVHSGAARRLARLTGRTLGIALVGDVLLRGWRGTPQPALLS